MLGVHELCAEQGTFGFQESHRGTQPLAGKQAKIF